MFIKKNWNRRDFIRAAGLSGMASVLLPFIPNLSSESNAETGGLKRLLLLTTGNGTVLDNWRNNGAGQPLTHNATLPELMGPILAPLNKYKENLLLLDGIDLTSVADLMKAPGGFYQGAQPISNGHSGHSVLWTGRHGKFTTAEGRAYPQGPSVDQIFNDAKGENRKSIQSGIWKTIYLTTQQLGSYDMDASPLTNEHDPQAIFDRVFAGGFNTAGDPFRRSRDKSAVDLLRREIGRIRKQLPSDDKVLLDRHVSGLNNLETGFADAGGVCNIDGSNRPNPYDLNALQKAFDDHTSLITSSFACDQVRSASFVMAPENQWGEGGPLGGLISGFSRRSIHGASHAVYDDMNAFDLMTEYQNFMAQQFAKIIDKLEAANVLDETLIVWGMGMGSGNHTNRNTPFVLHQGNKGKMKAGRYIQYGNYNVSDSLDAHGGESNNNLLVSVLHAMGMPEVTTVGPAEIPNSVGTSVLCKPDGSGLDDSLFGGLA